MDISISRGPPTCTYMFHQSKTFAFSFSPTASIFPLTSCRDNWLVFAVGTEGSGAGRGEEMAGRAAFQYRSGHPPISVNIELPTSPKWTPYYYPRHLKIRHFSLKPGASPMPANLTLKRHKRYLAGSLILAYPLAGNGIRGIAFCVLAGR